MTDDKKVINIFRDIIKKGYSILNIFKNTFFYFSKFDKETKNIHKKRYNIISKSFFCFFLQFKLKKGLILLANEENNYKK
jgi:hypothetical protein